MPTPFVRAAASRLRPEACRQAPPAHPAPRRAPAAAQKTRSSGLLDLQNFGAQKPVLFLCLTKSKQTKNADTDRGLGFSQSCIQITRFLNGRTRGRKTLLTQNPKMPIPRWTPPRSLHALRIGALQTARRSCAGECACLPARERPLQRPTAPCAEACLDRDLDLDRCAGRVPCRSHGGALASRDGPVNAWAAAAPTAAAAADHGRTTGRSTTQHIDVLAAASALCRMNTVACTT